MNNLEPSFFLQYLPMDITLISRNTAVLPAFLGSTLRGVIGQTLYRDSDAYNYLYHHGNMQDITKPYVIIPPQWKKEIYVEGDQINFKLFLLGEAVQYTQQVVNAIHGIGQLGLGASRQPFELIKITHSLDQRVIWENGRFYEISVRSTDLPFHCLPDVQRLHIQILTPLRIRRKGKLLDQLDFPTIIRNVTRRMKMLTEGYGGWVNMEELEYIQTLSADISAVTQQLEVVNMERYSNRLGSKMDFSGLMGDIGFEGALTPFVPWLYAGQILHMGRNTTFGMGRIKVEFA